jgi:hypothetical protein
MNTGDFPMARKQRALVGFVLSASFLTLAGCGNSNSVSGKITIGDKVVRGGNVTFFKADGSGGSGTSRIEQDGSYTIEKLPAGDYKIAVETKSMKPNDKAAAHVPALPKDASPEAVEEYKKRFPSNLEEKRKLYVPIPDLYGDPKTSGLTFTIAAGKNDHNIELK